MSCDWVFARFLNFAHQDKLKGREKKAARLEIAEWKK